MEVGGGSGSPRGKVKRKSLQKMKGEVRSPLNNNKKNEKVAKVTSPQTPVNTNINCLEGMSAAELTMVKRLAGNDPIVRKKTLRKLRKWLNVLSQKVPDTPDCRTHIEPNFVRVWKALFYCMWMADKPLPQEQLAESLSDLQNIFATKTQPFLLFVEWFIRTMAREWSWIDRFRMDKFMMLFRRFLRKTLFVIAEKKWQNDILEGYMKIIAMHIFNRHPPAKSKKLMTKTPVANAPLGLQIHFTDIFMEELAKAGGDSLKFQKILKILSIFINELAQGNDDRLLDEIRERVFNHLMRQSDVGMDYQEELAFGDLEEVEEEEEEEEGQDDDDDNNNTDAVLGEDDQFMDDEAGDETGVLDPRAGAVDVILPQLDVDYEKLYEKLVQSGGQKEVKLKNRRILYNLASQFKEITEGKYPLALPEDDNTKKPAIPKKEIKRAAKELVEMELGESAGKKKRSKKQRRRDAKRARELNVSADSVGSEDDSKYIQDEDLLDHVSDNYMSYLEDEIDAESTPNGKADEEEEEEDKTEDETPKRKSKGKKRKYKTVVEVEADEVADASSPKMKTENDASEEVNATKEEVILVKRPKLSKRASLGSSIVVSTPPLKGKARRLSELRTPINKPSPLNTSLTKSGSKRVSFVLARNLEHEHADYPVSIARSPAIPYDKNKLPTTQGLLKSPGPGTPKSTPIRRAAALDFF